MADKYHVKFLNRALNDLDEIYTYIANFLVEPKTAEKLVNDIEHALLSLDDMPYRCPERHVGSFAGKGYRQLFVKNYTVVFRIDEQHKTVFIVTIRFSRSHF